MTMDEQVDGGEGGSVRLRFDPRNSTNTSERSETWILEDEAEEQKEDSVPDNIFAEVRKGALEEEYHIVYEQSVKQPRGKKLHINGKLLIVKPKDSEDGIILFWLPHSTLLLVNPELLSNKETEAVVSTAEQQPKNAEKEGRYTIKVALDSIYSLKVEGRDVTLNILDNKSVRSVSLHFDGTCKDFKKLLLEKLTFVQKEPHVWVRCKTIEEQREYRDWLYDRPTADGIARGLLGLLSKGVSSLSSIINESESKQSGPAEGATPPPAQLHPESQNPYTEACRSSVAKPCLPTPTRSRAAPITLEQYNDLAAADNFAVARELAFRGSCTAEARPHVWRLVFGVGAASYAARAELFDKYYRQYDELTEDQLRHCDCVTRQIAAIDKDTHRTDRDIEDFRGEGGEGMCALRKILIAYIMYNRDLGYVQGMSDIAAVCWYVFKDIVDAFSVFCKVMERCLPAFHDHGEKEREVLRKILAAVNPTLSEHLNKEDPVSMFAFRWVFLLFKREFPFEQLLPLWDTLFAAPSPRYHLFVAASLLNLLSPQIYGLHDVQIIRFAQSLEGNISAYDTLIHTEDAWDSLSPLPELKQLLF